MLIQPLEKLNEKLGRFLVPILLSLFFVLTLAMMYPSVRQSTVTYREGQVVDESIRANKTLENKIATEQKRKIAVEAVTPEYIYQSEKEQEQHDLIEKLVTLIIDVKDNADETYQKKIASKSEGEIVNKATSEELVAALKKKFEKLTPEELNFYQQISANFFTEIFQLNKTDILSIKDTVLSLVDDQMKNQIKGSDLNDAKKAADNKLTEMKVPTNQLNTINFLIESGIVANTFLNEKRTAELQKDAQDAVQPVMIYQGEIIVREGSQIDSNAFSKLKLLGLTSQSTSFYPLVALILVISLQVGMLVYFVHQMGDKTKRLNCYMFYTSMMIISLVIMKFFQLFQTSTLNFVPLFFPAAFTPLVLNLFMNRRSGIMAAMFQVIFAVFVFNNVYSDTGSNIIVFILVTYLFSGVMGTLLRQQRISEQGFIAIIWLVIFPLLMSLILIIFEGMSFQSSQTWITLICSLAGSIFSLLLTIGLHQYIELLVTDDSVIVLNELSNPSHPLLKRLLEEAPGTYHHSMMVANLSANAVADIGGNSLLTRVACYYHDIGKLKHANFFVENLPAGAENPHNFLLPEDSREIIFGHVIDGAKLLEGQKMPQMVIDICRQHHGTTLMAFFYVKAKERNKNVTEDEYRYPGPKPQTKEAAVVSIADSCEAAVRAMGSTSNEKIQEFVSNLIQKRILDGQLDDSGLTLKEIKIIERSLINGLCSTFHSRIKYPKMKSEAEQMKEEQEKKEE